MSRGPRSRPHPHATAPHRDSIWPPVLLALALLCIIIFVHLARRSGPDRDRAPEATNRANLGSDRLTIEFLDIGQGDAALIRSPEGKLALIDAGPSPTEAASLLRERGVDRLDLVVVTHHHSDHYGGMLAVVREFHPQVFLDAPSPHASKAYELLLRTVRDEGITAIQPTKSPRKIELGSVHLTILPMPPPDAHNENNNSIGLRVDYGDFAALLTGDSEVAERAWWSDHAAHLCARVSILKLAHHGSRNGTSAAWLNLTRPELAVASLGADNEYGHPHPETLHRLGNAGVPLARTDQEGSITIRTDGATWTERDSRRRPAARLGASSPVDSRDPPRGLTVGRREGPQFRRQEPRTGQRSRSARPPLAKGRSAA